MIFRFPGSTGAQSQGGTGGGGTGGNFAADDGDEDLYS